MLDPELGAQLRARVHLRGLRAPHASPTSRAPLYERAVARGQPVVVDDLADLPGPDTRSRRSCCRAASATSWCAPLHYQDKVIGTLELVSPAAGRSQRAHLPKLQEVLPLFSMAVQRSMDELNSRIQTVIKEKCTAIHPVVEWRFRKAVLDSLERHRGECDRGHRDGADRLLGRPPALRARGHPRLVHPAGRGHPGRSPRPARGSPGTVIQRRATSPAPAGPRRARLSHRHARPPQIEREPRIGDEMAMVALPADGGRGAASIIFGRSDPASASASRRTGAPLDPRLGTVYQAARISRRA